MLTILLTMFFGSRVSAQELPAVVTAALKKAKIPNSAFGLEVVDLQSKRVLLEHNADMAFSPASTMKLVTTDAALELLGPTFSWKTQAYVTGSQTGDVLNGDLIIKGSGDPKLVLENFWLFLRQIRERGIRRIRGNLILDRSVFEKMPFDAAQFDGDPMKPYNAGPDALLLNFQSFRFHFIPNDATGIVNLAIDPPIADYPIAAPLLSHEQCGDWKSKLQLVMNDAGTRFAGSYPASCGEQSWYVHPPVMSSTRYFSLVFRRMWSDLGGTLEGKVEDGLTPPDARLVAEWQSAPLPEIIRDINKYSNNVMARQLLLTIAAHRSTVPANAQQGAQAIKEWLAMKSLEAPGLVIENGSGLSRNERIAPRTMAQMLVAAFGSPLMPEFISSLPLAGYDGTMRRRLNGRDVAGSAHIKTGSLERVRAIAGYVLAASGKRYALVFFINHDNASQAQGVHDAFLEWLYENG